MDLSHVCVSYPDDVYPLDTVDDFTYRFPDKGFFFLTGESGAGRNALLDAIGTLQKPTSGEVVLPPDFSFSYVFQDKGLIFSLSLVDNLLLVESDVAKIESVLKYVGLGSKSGKPVSFLSKGERVHLAIARALLSRSSAILLDEPTEDLDGGSTEKIFGLLSSVSKDRLVIVSTHDAESANAFGDVVLTLRNGKLAGEKRLKPLPEGKVLDSKKPNPRIPFSIKWRYSWNKVFSSPIKLVFSFVSLFLAGTLLLLSFNFAFYDAKKTEIRAVEDSSILFYDAYSYDEDASESKKVDFSNRLVGLGIKPTYQIGTANYTENLSARLIQADSLEVAGTTYSPADGEVLISDYMADVLGAKIGDDIANSMSYFIGNSFSVGGIVSTGYSAARSLFSNTSSGVDGYSTFLQDSYSFVIMNTATHLMMLEHNGLSMWNMTFGTKASQYNSTYAILATEASESSTLLYGRYPEAKDEVMLGESGARHVTGSDDLSAAVGVNLPVYPFGHDFFEMTKHFPYLKVVGVLSGTGTDCFYASQSFFNELKDETKYEEEVLVEKKGLLRYVEVGRPQDVGIRCASIADPLAAADSVSSLMVKFRNAFLGLGLCLALLSLALLSRYSTDVLKRNEKDVAILKTLGKGTPSISSLFALMNIFIAVFSVLLASIAGALFTWGVGSALEGQLFLLFNPVINSIWSFLILLTFAFAISFLVSAIVERKILTIIGKR